MTNKLTLYTILLCLVLTGCDSGAEKFFDDFYNQASGDWKSSDITVLTSGQSDLIVDDLSIKLTPCTASPCFLSFSLDHENYIDMEYVRGQGTGQGSNELSSMVLSMERYAGDKQTLSAQELLFVENIQRFIIDKFSSSLLDTNLFFENGDVLNIKFTPK